LWGQLRLIKHSFFEFGCASTTRLAANKSSHGFSANSKDFKAAAAKITKPTTIHSISFASFDKQQASP
jgi:hypothetical protein